MYNKTFQQISVITKSIDFKFASIKDQVSDNNTSHNFWVGRIAEEARWLKIPEPATHTRQITDSS